MTDIIEQTDEITKVLIVDDRPQNLIAMAKSLKPLGVEIIKANSGSEALSLIIEHEFALVLLDVQMPIMDGFETAELMRENKKTEHIPIIFVTAINQEDTNVFKGYRSGAVDFLFKPIDADVLRSKVQVFLDIYNKKTRRLEKVLEELQVIQSELEARNIELAKLAHHDNLTNLANRLEFEREMKNTLARVKRQETLFAILFIDVDNFKIINDSLGHQVGDAILLEVSKRLVEAVREDDVVARLGGDEFAIIMTDLHYTYDASKVANKIEQSFYKPIHIQGNNIPVSLSMGIACYPFAGTEIDTLVKNADIAMYRAKGIAGTNHQYFTLSLQEKYSDRIVIEEALSLALDNQEFYFAYQPIINLADNSIAGMEALMRWNNPKLGEVSPDVFIPIIENIGLMSDIGCWALETICKQYSYWVSLGHDDLQYALNISPMQLQDKSFIELITVILCKTNMPANLIEFELTESVLQDNNETCDDIMKKLPELGVGIAIDDFGTGYSSLTRLKQLPITAIKIDKSFVDDINNKEDEVIIKSVIMLADNLGLKVIAEGIETKIQLEFLRENKCTYGQGFYFHKPLSPSEMTLLLEEGEHGK